MPALVSDTWSGGRGIGEVARPNLEIERRDRAVIQFAAIQLFSTIYLQKIAVGTPTFQVRLPLIVMAAGLVWAVITRVISFSPTRCGLYMVFVGCSLVSIICSGMVGSLPSVLELWLMYSFFTVCFQTTPEAMRKTMALFVHMMVVPCAIVIFQYTYQKTTGLPDFLDMNKLLPNNLLLQGYFYNEHYPIWTSPFTRPNGFFFLEPSFMSQYAALAAIVEALYFRRLSFFLFFALAVIFSTGATGIVTLAIAGPFLLAREAPRTVASILLLGVIALGVGYAMDQLPFLSRLGEFGGQSSGSSGFQRMVIPAGKLVQDSLDPSYLITGVGPGQTDRWELGNGWAIAKLVHEYGVITAVSYMALFIAAVAANGEAIPLKVAMFVIFHFTGGYLFEVSDINFLVITCLFKSSQVDLRQPATSGHRGAWRS